jgi:Ca2+/Na+ antiporter
VEILRNALLVLHFVGLASLLGGVLVQLRSIRTGDARILPAILHGAYLQLLTGIGLVGVIQGAGLDDVDNVKIGVKFVVLIAITVLAVAYRRRKTRIPPWVVPAIGALTLLNIVVAVVW